MGIYTGMTSLLAREPRLDRSFERLYKRHAADVYRYAFGVLRNEADAEDVTQTTFLNAYRARRALREQLEGALTCDEAELSISKQLDSQLARAEKSQLRAHLRECPECATLARRQRAQRKALKAFGLVPLPSSLAGLFGSGTTIGLGLAVKTAAVVVVAGAVGA